MKEFTSSAYKDDVDNVMYHIYFPKDEDTQRIEMQTLIKGKMQFALVQAVASAKKHGGVNKIESAPAEYINTEKNTGKT